MTAPDVILLDTSAYTTLRRGDARVLELIAAAQRIYVFVVTLGDLIGGFAAGSRPERNMAELITFLDQPQVRSLDVTVETARAYGALFADLRSRGTPIPTNDIWIAAHAVELAVPVVTHDTHYLAVGSIDTVHLPVKAD